MNATPVEVAIRTEGLTKAYGSFLALDSVDLEIRSGEVFGYIGPNGSGKSTTIRMLCGLLNPTEGEIDVLARRSTAPCGCSSCTT